MHTARHVGAKAQLVSSFPIVHAVETSLILTHADIAVIPFYSYMIFRKGEDNEAPTTLHAR